MSRGRTFQDETENFVADEIRKVEAQSKLQLEEMELQKKIGPTLAEARKDDLIKQAVMKTAEDIVAGVMRANADKMNEAVGKQIEALVAGRLAVLEEMVEAAVEKRLAKFLEDLRSLDVRERQGFLAALEDIDSKSKSDRP